MKKSLALMLAVGVLTMGLAQPMNTAPLGFYILQSLEQVEIEGKVLGFGFLDGRFVLKVDDSYVLFPLRLLGTRDFVIEFGETLKVVGRKVDVGGKVLILPGKVYCAGREFNLGKYLFRFMEMRRERLRAYPGRFVGRRPLGGRQLYRLREFRYYTPHRLPPTDGKHLYGPGYNLPHHSTPWSVPENEDNE